jgi:hypothetical protein
MKKGYLIILLLINFAPVWSQLNCHTIKIFSGDSTICFHQKGSISTITFPSKQHERYYHFQAFDLNGNKVLETSHGVLHGSASLDVKYHANGAIKSARRTFQPDGGIQHYDATTFYHEDGTFSHEEDNSWDRQLTVPVYDPSPIVHSKEEEKKEKIEIQLLNLTASKQRVLVVNVKNPLLNKIVRIKRNQRLVVDTVEGKALNFKLEDYCRFEVLPKKRNRIFRIQSLGILTNQFEVVYVILPDAHAIKLK